MPAISPTDRVFVLNPDTSLGKSELKIEAREFRKR